MIEDQYHNKQWSVADFERYHSQQMSNEERHALEKAALEDPFLEDALEGYAYASTPIEDVAVLKQKLQPEQSNRKVIWLTAQRRNQFLKVAAMLLLIAGLTWLLIPPADKPSTELASISNAGPDTATQPDRLLERTDTQTAAQPLAERQTAPPAIVGNTTTAVSPAIAQANSSPEPAVAENKMRDAAAKTANEKEAAAQQAKVASPYLAKGDEIVENNIIRGRVVDAKGAPIPYATVQVPESNSNVAADVNGAFLLRNNLQPNVVASVNAPGFETARAPMLTGTDDNKIVLKESQQSLEEVVVAGYGQNRKKSSPAVSNNKSANIFGKVAFINAAPLSNSEAFADSLRLLSGRLVADTSGYVLLRFKIDAAGKATNISISKSLCDICDSSAVKLLQQVPALKRTNKIQPAARIAF